MLASIPAVLFIGHLTGLLLQINTAVTVLVLTVIVGVVTVLTLLNTDVKHAPAFDSSIQSR